jgi:hypothetical protein
MSGLSCYKPVPCVFLWRALPETNKQTINQPNNFGGMLTVVNGAEDFPHKEQELVSKSS